MGVEEVPEPLEHRRLEAFGLGHEVGPVAERAGDVAAVLGEHGQLLADDSRVVTGPHPRSAGARPEVGTDPGTLPVTLSHFSAFRGLPEYRRH